MRFIDYAAAAGETAIYPDRGQNFAYTALGLAEEAAELLGAGSRLHGFEREFDDLLDEAGDVLWFVSQCGFEGRLYDRGWEPGRLEDVSRAALEGLPHDARVVPALGGPFLFAAVVEPAGRVAGIAAKAIRDSGGEIPAERLADLADVLDDVLGALARVVSVYSRGRLDLADIADRNLEKLASRKERDVLSGSGDHR